MASKNPFDKIRASADGMERSLQWYRAQVRKLGSVSPNKLIREGKLTTRIFPGEMYLYGYDPKTKDTLPYYDIFPLVLPFRSVEDGFLGINLHYLPYGVRMFTLKELSKFASDDNLDEKTRIKFSWRLLETSVRFEPAKACVKHYLYGHVQTRFMKIPYPDWIIASQLPVDRFVGAQKETVWKDTQRKYRNVSQSVF
jgi:hypothetical protein